MSVGLSSDNSTRPLALGAGSLLAGLASFGLLAVAGNQHTSVSGLYIFVLLVALAGVVLGALSLLSALSGRIGHVMPGTGVGVVVGVLGFLASGAVSAFGSVGHAHVEGRLTCDSPRC